MFTCVKLRSGEHSCCGWRYSARGGYVLRTVVVMDRSDRIVIAYSIVLDANNSQPNEEAFIIEARRKAREQKLARGNDLPDLKFLLL